MEGNTKKCRFCGEEIKAEAVKCRHCGEFLQERPPGMPPPPQAEGGSPGPKIACFVVAALAVFLCAIAVLGILAAILLPALSNAREAAKRAKCVNNLRQIGLGLRMYANDFSDELPSDLSLLSPQYISGPLILVCPSTQQRSSGVTSAKPSPPSYVYIPPGMQIDKITTPANTTILSYDKAGNHRGGANVLYLDGHVAWQKGFAPPNPPPKKETQ